MDYEGVTDERNRCTDDSLTEDDDFVKNFYKEHKNEDNEEFKEYSSVINIKNESKKS